MVASLEYIEKTIAAYEKATELNLSTPGREGTVVVVDEEMADEVMITGDLHGNRRNYNLIRKTAALERHPRRHLVLQEVCHGGPTYPANGGCTSHAMLEDVARLKVEFPERVHFLLGNHELAEMTDYPIRKNHRMLNLMFGLGMQFAYGPAADKVRQAFIPFLQSCPLAIRMPGGIFISHSVPERVDERHFDRTVFTREVDSSEYYTRTGIFELVWGRDYRQANADAFARLVDAKVLINGHEPCSDGYNVPNTLQIVLDCCGEIGCYVILRPGQPLSQAEIVQRIRRL